MAEGKYHFLPDLSNEDKVLLDKLSDWARSAQDRYFSRFSAFLDERQCLLCEKLMSSMKYENYELWGGYENAQRKMVCVYSDYAQPAREDFPLKAVTFTYRSGDKLTHRDFLGSLMGQRITRDSVGDILVNDGQTVVFVRESIADDVLLINKIGRIGVKAQEGFEEGFTPQVKMQEISGTVASLRADCVLSLAIRASREKSAQLIKNTGIEIDHFLKNAPKALLEEGCVFSVRGHGKFKLVSVDGVTKKDRIHITLQKFV